LNLCADFNVTQEKRVYEVRPRKDYRGMLLPEESAVEFELSLDSALT
jgi:hypothetical protein